MEEALNLRSDRILNDDDNYYISNKGLLENYEKEGTVEVTVVATISCLKRKL